MKYRKVLIQSNKVSLVFLWEIERKYSYLGGKGYDKFTRNTLRKIN